MSDKQCNDSIRRHYSAHAVIFGADESLLKIHLKDGFCFKRMSLIPSKDGLDSIFDLSDLGLRREYETAIIDSNALDVICAVKERPFVESPDPVNDQFLKDVEKDVISLDNQIRVIRLIKECPLRFKNMAFHLCSEKQIIDGTTVSSSNSCIVPFSEAMTTKQITTFHCDTSEAEYINKTISNLSFPLSNLALNSCHIYYDLSYHQKSYVAITLLTTALETIFLDNSIKGQKKEVLAKRCSVFLHDDDDDILQTYADIKELYRKRSEFVHEGNAQSITDVDIIKLRSYVRDALLKALELSEEKATRVKRLQALVQKHLTLYEE